MVNGYPQEFRQEVRRIVKHPTRSPFYNAISDIPHNVHYADGEKVYIVNGANWDEYMFHRTGSKPDDGQWLPTGITTGAAATW